MDQGMLHLALGSLGFRSPQPGSTQMCATILPCYKFQKTNVAILGIPSEHFPSLSQGDGRSEKIELVTATQGPSRQWRLFRDNS